MEALKKHFDRSRTNSLSLSSFIEHMLELLKCDEKELVSLFMKIDSGSTGYIEWAAFCTYMQLELREKEDSYARLRHVGFVTPAVTVTTPHRDTIHRISLQSDSTYLTSSQDGILGFWNPKTLQLKRFKSVSDANRTKQKWITDFVLMTNTNRIIIATGDRELHFYDGNTFDPYCHISSLESVPLTLNFWHDPRKTEECIIMFGDNQGCINVLVIPNTTLAFRKWKQQPRVNGIPTANLERVSGLADVKYFRWDVHNDWVVGLKYEENLRSIISCSNDPSTGVVIGNVMGSTNVESVLKESNIKRSTVCAARKRLPADQTVFYVYKGVKMFAYSEMYNILVTGGMDRILRIWNPYVNTKPTALLRGHNAPISYLHISDREHRIYTISTDKTVRVWDLQDHSPLCSVGVKSHAIQGELACALYNQDSKTLVIATENLSLLRLSENKYKKTEQTLSHQDSIFCTKYNHHFKQVVSADSASLVKVWDIETGSNMFEFSNAHANSTITSMTFDRSGRRLVTSGRDGVVRIWNYNNGQCIRTLIRDNKDEVNCVIPVTVTRNKYIVCVGWDRKINVFNDLTESLHHEQFPLPQWKEDIKHGHKEDILYAAANTSTNQLATSSYDGEIIVWSLVSGHIFCRLQHHNQTLNQAMLGDAAVTVLMFLSKRGNDRTAATLISCGPNSQIHFWNVYKGGDNMACFSPVSEGGASMIEVNNDNTVLVCGDSTGCINVYDISQYALVEGEKEAPALLSRWRAHTTAVQCIELITLEMELILLEFVLTASDDCSLRLWTGNGHYVGTFGQREKWDIYDENTYAHPRVPGDVLKVFSEPIEIHSSIVDNIDEEDNDFCIRTSTKVEISDVFESGEGARCRHVKRRKNIKNKTSVYNSLPCFDITDTPPQRQPPVTGSLDPLSILDAVEIESLSTIL